MHTDQVRAVRTARTRGPGRPVDALRPADSELLTPREVAAAFGVDGKTITRWVNTGRLTALRTLGGHRRFRAGEIYAVLETTRGAPPPGRGSAAITTPAGQAADELIPRLRTWALGQSTPVRAAIDLLIEDGYWLHRPDFVTAAVTAPRSGEHATISWRVLRAMLAIGRLEPAPPAELGVLELAVALGEDRLHLADLSAAQAQRMAKTMLRALSS